MTALYDNANQDMHIHRERQEELARHVEDLVDELKRERGARARLEEALADLEKSSETEIRRERRALEAKDSALQSSLNDLAKSQTLLSQRETDFNAVQASLKQLELESKRTGETATTARFSLQLEADRLKRDIERLENELSRARKDLEERDGKFRDRDNAFDALHSTNRDLETKLAAQTQARLNISDKLDVTQASLKTAEAEIASLKSKSGDLEGRLSKDQRALLSAETQFRDQLTERNTLLLTIYQYMDKILGVDKTPVCWVLFLPRSLV